MPIYKSTLPRIRCDHYPWYCDPVYTLYPQWDLDSYWHSLCTVWVWRHSDDRFLRRGQNLRQNSRPRPCRGKRCSKMPRSGFGCFRKWTSGNPAMSCNRHFRRQRPSSRLQTDIKRYKSYFSAISVVFLSFTSRVVRAAQSSIVESHWTT